MLSVERCDNDFQPNVKQYKRKALETLLNKVKKRKSVKSGTHDEKNGLEKADDSVEHKKESFTILGRYETCKTTQVQPHLPAWLANPNLISSDLRDDLCPIEEISALNQTVLEKLRSHDINFLFPVQKMVIPWLVNDSLKFGLSNMSPMRPRDMCVSAPTGSGKTLAYVLPIIQCLSRRSSPKIRALVVVPVQELANQVTSVFRMYCKGTNLKVESATGKTPLALEQSKLVKCCDESLCEYESLVDILVTTPGRLVEHLENTKGFDLSELRYLVMDEADRMVDNIQNNWLHHLDKHINFGGFKGFSQMSLNDMTKKKRHPQKLLFSATLSQDPEMLKRLNLYQPVLFSTVSGNSRNSDKTDDYIGSFTTPSELKEKYIIVDPTLKPLVLCELFNLGWRNVLCFVKSAIEAHKLSLLLSILNPEMKITELSALLPAEQREQILNSFSSGLIHVLVCSDVMARGVDIIGVKYVISYDPPKHIKSYIHRVGRTGRAGHKGKAVTLLSSTQAPVFKQMLLDVNKNNLKEMAVDEEHLKVMLPKYKIALQELKLLLNKEESKQCVELKKEKKSFRKRKTKAE